MKIILSLLMSLTISVASTQTIKQSLKNPDGEIKVFFVSTYKIKVNRYGAGMTLPLGKKVGDRMSTEHKIDKSMMDDNSLLLDEWYKLTKKRLESMGLKAPDDFEYLGMYDIALYAKEMQEKINGVNQWIMITCNDLKKAQKAQKKGTLSLDSFTNVAISVQNAKGARYGKGGKNLTIIFDKLENEIK